MDRKSLLVDVKNKITKIAVKRQWYDTLNENHFIIIGLKNETLRIEKRKFYRYNKNEVENLNDTQILMFLREIIYSAHTEIIGCGFKLFLSDKMPASKIRTNESYVIL